MQPDEDTLFGRHLKEVAKYLNIGLPSFTGTFNATLPEEERWKIHVHVQVPSEFLQVSSKGGVFIRLGELVPCIRHPEE